MPPLKTSYTELTHRVVRESREPLPLDEITRRVSAIEPITTKNPKGTIRNAISQSRLIVNTGDGRYGWKYRVIKGSVLRLTLSELDCQGKVMLRDSHPAIWRRLSRRQCPASAVARHSAIGDGSDQLAPAFVPGWEADFCRAIAR